MTKSDQDYLNQMQTRSAKNDLDEYWGSRSSSDSHVNSNNGDHNNLNDMTLVINSNHHIRAHNHVLFEPLSHDPFGLLMRMIGLTGCISTLTAKIFGLSSLSELIHSPLICMFTFIFLLLIMMSVITYIHAVHTNYRANHVYIAPDLSHVHADPQFSKYGYINHVQTKSAKEDLKKYFG